MVAGLTEAGKARMQSGIESLHLEYQKYCEAMYEHGCGEVALTFEAWIQL